MERLEIFFEQGRSADTCPQTTINCPAMPGHEMLIVKKAFDFSKWLLHQTGKFPKSFRFSIAVRLENSVLEFTELVAVANMRSNKLPALHEADGVLTRLRILFRMSFEMKLINLTSYEFGSQESRSEI